MSRLSVGWEVASPNENLPLIENHNLNSELHLSTNTKLVAIGGRVEFICIYERIQWCFFSILMMNGIDIIVGLSINARLVY